MIEQKEYEAAKAAYLADKSNKALKKKYKAAKKALKAAEAKAAEEPAKKNGKRKQPDSDVSLPLKKKAKTEEVDVDDLAAKVKAAKKAYKADKSNAELKKAYKAAKKALDAAKAKGGEAEEKEMEVDAAEEKEEKEEAGEADMSMLASLKKGGMKQAGGGKGGKAPQPAGEPNEKVFVGNLSWDIDENGIKKFFADCGEINDVYFLEDRDTGRFRGCGFLTFDSIDASTKAVAKDQEDCMGRPINVNFARGRPNGGGGGGRGGGGKGGKGAARPLSEKPDGCTTVFCGNLSYDIDDDKMREFAKDCGDIKAIRWLTDRESGDFRGMGFIEFHDGNSVDEFVKKNNADLMGRPIRIDYAKPRAPRE